MAGMYNLFLGAQRKTFVQFILGGARKKVLVHKKMHDREFIVVAREIRSPRGRSEFSLNIFVNPGPSRYHIHMTSKQKRRETGPIRVGGELMLRLLNEIQLDTLEQVKDDIGPPTFKNIDLVRTIDIILENRRRTRLLEEGDTVSFETEFEY